MWLNTHKIPLELITSYLSIFYPVRLQKVMQFKPFTLSTPTLRLLLRRDDMSFSHRHDLSRVFKHKALFPSSVITFHSLLSDLDGVLQYFDRFINNSNSTWMQWVSKGRISQVRLGTRHCGRPGADIVVKEKFSEPWMKTIFGQRLAHEVERFLERFGIEPMTFPNQIQAYVDYS